MDVVLQVEYNNWLAGQCGGLAYEEWRISMCCAAFKSRATQPKSYRMNGKINT